MIGLVLVTHGRLADEFKAALEHVMGPQKQIEAITIGAEDDSDLCRSDIIEAHNGRIWAENRHGPADADGKPSVAGARFVVRLPAL